MGANVAKNPLFCVEYPGVIENEAQMLKTIGGVESLSEVVIVMFCIF